jgi:Kef-type K+ transport system membrane component KefB
MALKKLHDKLDTLQAAASGKTAEQFKEAAQKHANAAWFLLIMAAVVWYFLGFVWALIPGALVIYGALMSFSSTSIARRLEKSDSPHL